MIIVYMVASLIGGTATAALVAPHSLVLGLFAVPLGGSLAAVATASLALLNGSRSDAGQSIPPDVVWC